MKFKTFTLYFSLICCVLISYTNSFCQTPISIEVSKQEFSSKIQNFELDNLSNIYYGGNFYGALTVEGDTLLYGNGLTDHFIVKTDSTGKPLWSICIGSDQQDSYWMNMLYQNNALYISIQMRFPFKFGDTLINDVTYGELTNFLAKVDTSGNLLWIKRSSIQILKMLPGTNKIIGECVLDPLIPDLIYDNELIFSFNGFINRILLSIDEQGNVINKDIFYHNSGKNAGFIEIADTLNHRFYFIISTSLNATNSNNNRIFIGNSSILLPTSDANSVLVKTDSAFNMIGYKILNLPSGNIRSVRISSNNERLNILTSSGNYNIDGYNVNMNNTHTLISIDTSFVTQSVKKINQSSFTSPSRVQNVLGVEEDENGYFIFGTIPGRNNSLLIDEIPELPANFNISESFTQTINLNGPNRLFILRTNKNFEKAAFLWLDKDSVNVNRSLSFNTIRIKNDHLFFINQNDGVWSTWKISKDLVVKQGSLKRVPDNADYVGHVGFFSNKTAYLIGSANGKNAFDSSSAGIINTTTGSDVFITLFLQNGNIQKYHRIFSSFNTSIVTRTRMVYDTLYVLVGFSTPGNQSGFNFFKLDTITRMVAGSTHRALFKIDKSGHISYVDFQNTPIGVINDFDVYNNGDLAVLGYNTNISLNLNGLVFPYNYGYYIAKLNQAGHVKQAVKIHQPSANGWLEPRKINLEQNQEFISLLMTTWFEKNLSEIQMTHFRNGSEPSIKSISNPMPGETIRKFYLMPYRLSFTSNLDAGILGPFPNDLIGHMVTMGKSNIVVLNMGLYQPLKYNNQPISTPGDSLYSYVISLDSSLQYYKHLEFKESKEDLHNFRFVSWKTFNNQLYLSGQQTDEINFGALKIPYKGNIDGVTIKADSALNILQYFKVSSPYSEYTTDFAIHTDSSFLVGYRSQTKPQINVGLNTETNFYSNSIKPSDYPEQGYVTMAPTALLPNDFVFSVKKGNWHDPTIWSTGKVPVTTDKVFIKHKVQVDGTAKCFTLFVDLNADLQIAPGNLLEISGAQQQ